MSEQDGLHFSLLPPSQQHFHTEPTEGASKATKYRCLAGFFAIGLLNNFGYVVMLSAALDILHERAGKPLPAGSVLLADILPTLILKAVAPWHIHRIPYTFRVWFIVISAVAAFHTVAWIPGLPMKFFGIVLASMSSGFGEMTFLALTAQYDKDTVSTWSSGTGGAGIFGAFSYLVFTSWMGLTSQVSLAISSVFPMLILVCYAFVLTKPTKVVDEVEMHAEGEDTLQEESIEVVDPGPSDVSVLERLKYVKCLLPYMVSLFVVYFAEYLINQGIAPVIYFSNAPFSQRDHYVYYQFLYQTGVFISRSSVNIFPIKRLWILPVLQVMILLTLLSHALGHWIPNVWIVFIIIFVEGLLGGATYCNAFYRIRNDVQPKWREFSLGVASVADSCGIALAGFTGLYVQPALSNS